MVIFLDNSLQKLDYKLNTFLIHSLDNIALCVADGLHIVLGDRETLKYISNLNISTRSKSIFEKIYADQSQNGLFKHEVNSYIKVTDTHNFSKSSNFIEVPLTYFGTTQHIQPTKLLCEHLNEINFYGKIASCYIKRKRYNINLSYEKLHGGGSSIGIIYDDIQNENRTCLAIADSDKYFKDDSLKSTAEQLLKADCANKPLSNIYILPVREIENFITSSLLSATIENNRELVNLTNSMQILKNLERKDAFEVIKYLDFKKGFTYKDFLAYHKEYFPDLIQHCSFSMQESCNKSASCMNSSACECILMPGFGDYVLSSVSSYINSLSCTKLYEALHVEMKVLWDEIALQIVTWCSSSQRKIT
jgi:hypothetical protein